jgi:hypothetical protein
MTDSHVHSVARVIEVTRGRREPAKATPPQASDLPSVPVPSPEIFDDVPQLHLASTVAKAASGGGSLAPLG